MNTLRLTHALIALIFVASLGTLAAQEGDTTTSITLEDGKVITCTVLSDDGETIKIRRFDDKTEAEYAYADLSIRTVLRLMAARVDKADADGQMKIAAFALENEYFSVARTHYRLAVKADKELGGELEKRLEDLRQTAAKTVLRWSKEQIKAGELVEAERYLGIILQKFPDTEMSVEAATLLDEIAEKSMAERHRKIEERAEKIEGKAMARLEPAKKKYDEAHELMRKGLKDSGDEAEAVNDLRGAITRFQSAKATLESVERNVPDDQPLKSQLASHHKALIDDMVECYLRMANLYMVRDADAKAVQAVNAALKLDAESQEAKDLKTQLLSRTKQDSGGGGDDAGVYNDNRPRWWRGRPFVPGRPGTAPAPGRARSAGARSGGVRR